MDHPDRRYDDVPNHLLRNNQASFTAPLDQEQWEDFTNSSQYATHPTSAYVQPSHLDSYPGGALVGAGYQQQLSHSSQLSLYSSAPSSGSSISALSYANSSYNNSPTVYGTTSSFSTTPGAPSVGQVPTPTSPTHPAYPSVLRSNTDGFSTSPFVQQLDAAGGFPQHVPGDFSSVAPASYNVRQGNLGDTLVEHPRTQQQIDPYYAMQAQVASGMVYEGGPQRNGSSGTGLQDSLMAYDEGFDNSSGISASTFGGTSSGDDVLYFDAGSSSRSTTRYQYPSDGALQPPPPGSAGGGSYPPTPSSSSADSSLYPSPYPGTHSLPPTAYNSPQQSPHQGKTPLPVSSIVPPHIPPHIPGTGYSPLPSPSFPAGSAANINFPPSPTSLGPTPSPTSPFTHGTFPQFSPQGAPANRISSRSQPNSRTSSFSHLPTYSPYPLTSPRPNIHHRQSSSTSSSGHQQQQHTTPNPQSPASFGRPSPSVLQSPYTNQGPTTPNPPPTVFDSPPKPQGRIRQSLSFPSASSALHHRRTQSYSTRGVGGSNGGQRRESVEELNGLGFSIGRRPSIESEWSQDGGSPNKRASISSVASVSQHPPSTPGGFSGDQGWGERLPGTPEIVGAVRDRLEDMSLDRSQIRRDHGGAMDMDRGEGTVVLVRGNEALDDSTRDYLDSANRLDKGERAVLVLAPRVAQRSYGNEKRFLCPQPMALLLGASWWSNVEDPSIKQESLPYVSAQVRRFNLPPEINISISTDPNPAPEPLFTEWMGDDGELVSTEYPNDAELTIYSGRATGKQNYIPSSEGAKDKRAPVQPLVTIHAPGPEPRDQSRLIGTFPGKPMHIISKPSKGKLTETSKISLVHGDLVALYNRTKAQTASTRFLGVSGNHSSFPTMDWRAMSGGQARPFAPTDIHSTTFISRTGRWDAFVIYAVDLTLPTLDPNIVPAPAPHQGYPRPPVNAIPFDSMQEKKIYYNMPVVLQCLSTAVVSPVMIIRKVETNRTVIGGGSNSGYSAIAAAQGLPCAPGERLGEAVAQFRPIALEIYTDPNKARSGDPTSHPPPENTFLACLGDAIGINQSREVRKYFHPSSSAPDSDSPNSPATPITPVTPTSGRFFSSGVPTPMENQVYEEDISANGTKVKRLRRLSSSNNVPQAPYGAKSPARPASTLSKHKRRGQSLSNLSQLTDQGEDDPGPNVWSIDCGDPCVWTVVAIDLARHVFHIPEAVTGGKFPGKDLPASTCSPLYKTPIPCYPISPLIPSVVDYDPPMRRARPGDTGSEEETMITLHGENFSSAFTVWLGSSPCPRQMQRSSWRLLVSPPHRKPDLIDEGRRAPGDGALRISFVRNDGIVFPSCLYYRDHY
ncbi:hypothetical protein T439DRAFT_356727 [Meredithblackwellia eburnea MCA 4105]